MGAIVLDTDLPTLFNDKLPIGVTLDPGSYGRDLLNSNILINGNFELAPRLAGTGYDATTREVITPNGSHLFYPLPEHLHGWKVLGGDIHLTGEEHNHQLLIQASSNDSLVAIKQPLQGVRLQKGDSFRLSLEAKSYGTSTIKATIVDQSLTPLSKALLLKPSTQDSLLYGHIVASEECQASALLLEINVEEGTPYLIQRDSVSFWSSQSRATITLDDIRLTAVLDSSQSADIESQLYPLLDSLSPSFVRFPSGATANGLFPGTYPVHQDSLKRGPLWTLNQNEYTGAFGYNELLQLANALKCSPILVTNFGFTDPSTIQRVEDIKLLPQRIEATKRVIQKAPNQDVIIQPGYNLTGAEYDRRFSQLIDRLDTIFPNLQLISAGDRAPYQRFSDYSYDLVLPPITYDRLEIADSLLTAHDRLFYPQMVSEVTFDHQNDDGYFLPPLALRAAFLILAEQRTPYIKALGISPLLSTEVEKDFPIILVKNGAYKPTLLYHYLQDFTEQRGEHLCRMSGQFDLKSDIITSLSSNASKEVYYLKAVNVTRHPLHYQIKLKGKNSDFSTVQITSYTSTAPTTSQSPEGFAQYERKVTHKKLPLQRQINYLFAPYEVVIFKFQ